MLLPLFGVGQSWFRYAYNFFAQKQYMCTKLCIVTGMKRDERIFSIIT